MRERKHLCVCNFKMMEVPDGWKCPNCGRVEELYVQPVLYVEAFIDPT